MYIINFYWSWENPTNSKGNINIINKEIALLLKLLVELPLRKIFLLRLCFIFTNLPLV